MGQKTKVAFVCVHNSCRSQIAEALSKLLASDVFDSSSAGTEEKPQINQDAVRLVKQLYSVHVILWQNITVVIFPVSDYNISRKETPIIHTSD